MSTCSKTKYDEFYRYSSGRWLWNEETQLRKRYKRFNVPELQRIAARSVDAQACVSMIKLAEGGFNKVFRLVMDNSSVVIARIPNPDTSPPFKATASEVATMDFALTVLGLPVPKVLSWSGKVDNPVESEYILMQEAVGTQLGEIWDDMELDGKLEIVEEIIAVEKKFLSLSFTRYGNIYFSNDRFPSCQTAEIQGDVPESLKRDVESRFVIGPVLDTDFWDGERKSMDIHRGPWTYHQDYLKAISQREIAWLSQYAVPRPSYGILAKSAAQHSPDAHTALYKKFRAVADHLLPEKEEHVRPTLWHWDIHAPNIFVDKNKITSLIDWQDVWAGPLFLQARHPRLVDYNGEFLLRFPEHYKALENENEKARIRTQVEKPIVLWAYESDTKKANPVLHEILHIPHGRTRRDTVDFSANTWDRDIIPFRQCLIRVERHWNEISSTVSCPTRFTHDDLKEHTRDGQGWNDNADFWASLEGFVHRDGWTSNENYEQALEMFRELRDQGLRNLTGEERSEFEKQTRWAERKSDSMQPKPLPAALELQENTNLTSLAHDSA